MLESTMELSNKNDLLGILLARNSSDAQAVDAHAAQHESGDDAGNGYPLPFHEILGQKITNLTVQDMRNSEKSNHSAPGLSGAELFPESSEEMGPSSLKKTHMGGSSQGNGKNSTIHSSFTKKSEEGLEQNISGNQISNTILSVAILPETFVEYSQTNIQNADQHLSLRQDADGVNAPFGIDTPFVPHANGKDSSLLLQFTRQTAGGDTRQNEVFFDANTSGILYTGETSLMHNQNNENTLILSDIVGSNPTQKLEGLQKLDMSIFSTMQESNTTDAYRNEINMMKLPTMFKTLAQNLSAENMHNTLVMETDNPADTAERHTENDLSKTMNKVSSQEGILNTPQTNEEWDLFDRSGSKQNTSDKDETQANAPDFQQKTEIFSSSDVIPSSSPEGRNNNVSHTFHGSSSVDSEHRYSNSIEQFFKEIRLMNHGDKISLVNHGDRSEIKLSLTPPELGSVEIHFTQENDEIEAKIFVENAEVKAAIEDNVHRLKESVAASGLEIQKLEVFIQNDNASKEKSFNNSDAHNQSYQTRGQEWMNGEHSTDENSIGNDVQKKISVKTSNVMVDYII